MRRAIAFAAIAFVVGCGEGPKHLPKSDYQRGKAAFEMLEQWDRTGSSSFALAGMQQIHALNLDTAIQSGLIGSLTNYERALSLRDLVVAKRGDPEELAPVIKLCRDDAAQYFDRDAASTNTCDSSLKAYEAKYNKEGESK